MSKGALLRMSLTAAGLAALALLSGCARISVQVDSTYPSNPAQPLTANVGETVPLRLTFTNSGNRTTEFITRVVLWDRAGIKAGQYESKVQLRPGEKTTQTWNHTVAKEGTFTVQFQVLRDPTTILAVSPKEPAALLVVTGAPPVQASGKFKIGDKVQTTDNVNVRTGPSKADPEVQHVNYYLGYMPAGIQGQITDGPKQADGYTWWKVKFATGVEGWCIEEGLQKVSS